MNVISQSSAKSNPASESDILARQAIDAACIRAWELRESDPRQAQKLAQQALSLSQAGSFSHEPYKPGIVQSLKTLGWVSLEAGDLGLALSQLFEAQSLFEADSVADSVTLAIIKRYIGVTHFRLGNVKEATQELLLSRKYAVQAGRPDLEAIALASLGWVYLEDGEQEQAKQVLFRAVQLESGESSEGIKTLNNLALTLVQVGSPNEALPNALEALRIARHLKLSSLECSVLDTVGRVYLALKDYSQAESYLQQALDLSRLIGIQAKEFGVLLELGSVFLYQGNLEQAENLLQQALRQAEEQKLTNVYEHFHQLLARVYERKGELKKALSHYRLNQISHDLAQEQAAAHRLAHLKILHQVETARKEAEIQHLHNLALQQQIKEHRQTHARLEQIAITDALTLLFNRRHFFTVGEAEFERALSNSMALSVLILDIDHFKLVNDRYGHPTGDVVLTTIARKLEGNAREGDICCRYGGEEFVILLPNTDTVAARQVADRLREKLASEPIQTQSAQIYITASCGISQINPQDTGLTDVLHRADMALYTAKQSGRNRTVIYANNILRG